MRWSLVVGRWWSGVNFIRPNNWCFLLFTMSRMYPALNWCFFLVLKKIQPYRIYFSPRNSTYVVFQSIPSSIKKSNRFIICKFLVSFVLFMVHVRVYNHFSSFVSVLDTDFSYDFCLDLKQWCYFSHYVTCHIIWRYVRLRFLLMTNIKTGLSMLQ